MKLPNWFKILWWILLLLLLSYAIYVRFPNFKTGNATAIDCLVLIIWFALALVPIFKEIHLPGIKLTQEREPLKNQLDIIEKPTESSALVSSETKETLKKFDSPLLVEQEKMLKKDMESINPATAEEKEEILYKALATNQISLAFEKTYLTIYGSQMKALQYLNETVGTGVKITDIKIFYEQAKVNYPTFYATYSFEKWLNYLYVSVLITQLGEKTTITIRGQEFLKYLISQRYILNKTG